MKRYDVLKEYSMESFKLTGRGTIEFTFKGVIDMEELYYINTEIDIIDEEGSE